MENEIQFDQVQRPAGGSTCSSCHGALFDSYYQANGRILCERCAANIRNYFQSTEGGVGRFAQAAFLGIGAGLGGGAVYAAVLAFANVNAALITILIGWLVGKGVRKGSGNRGGREYQVLAVVITYLIIGLSIMASAVMTMEEKHAGAHHDPLRIAIVCIIGAFTVPIQSATSSLFSGLITIFGLMQAWRMTKAAQVVITGPHAIAPASQAVSREPIVPSEPTPPPALPTTEPPPAPSA
jgi:hypothetical protein